jgi:hypothetical protein
VAHGLNDVAATGRRRAPDIILTAPRGVGKTATVLAFQDISQDQGFEVIRLQASAGNAGLVDGLLRRARRADRASGPWSRARRAFERIASLNVNVLGSGAGLSLHDGQPGPTGSASSEDVAEALATLAREVRSERPGGGVMLALDEIQVAPKADLTLLAAALHGLNAEYPDAPVMFAASGLPHTFQVLDRAGVTHPDRLFKFRPVPLLLEPADARYAIVEAARVNSVAWEPEAADLILQISRGYPAHLQVFADTTWQSAAGPELITVVDARAGIAAGIHMLEQESLGPRFEGLTGRQREFLAALAVHGGQTSTAVLAQTLGRSQKSLSDRRNTLISTGDVYQPRRGELALAVPVFGRYLLDNYEAMRSSAGVQLLPLADIERQAARARSARAASRSSKTANAATEVG